MNGNTATCFPNLKDVIAATSLGFKKIRFVHKTCENEHSRYPSACFIGTQYHSYKDFTSSNRFNFLLLVDDPNKSNKGKLVKINICGLTCVAYAFLYTSFVAQRVEASQKTYKP